jgi:hypothetical protein
LPESRRVFFLLKGRNTVTYRPTDEEIATTLQRLLRERMAAASAATFDTLSEKRGPAPERSHRSRQSCHRFSLYERPRFPPPPDTGAYVPELAARLEDDRNLTDGARRCARKLAEYAYRRNRQGRAAEITVSYLTRALGRCRRTVQRYLRLLEREGYVQVDVVYGDRSRMCIGLVVQLLGPLFPRHRRENWPGRVVFPDATPESQNKRFTLSGGRDLHRMPAQEWALRCMDGVYRSLMKTIPPLDPRLRHAA